MRWRNSYLCALGIFIALAAVPVFHGNPHVAEKSGGISAPFIPGTSIEAAPVAHLLPSQFHGYGHALPASNLSFKFHSIPSIEVGRQFMGVARPYYGPLHRRPPPDFS